MKGTIERIEENDEPRKRISERTSVQTRPLSDKVNRSDSVRQKKISINRYLANEKCQIRNSISR